MHDEAGARLTAALPWSVQLGTWGWPLSLTLYKGLRSVLMYPQNRVKCGSLGTTFVNATGVGGGNTHYSLTHTERKVRTTVNRVFIWVGG